MKGWVNRINHSWLSLKKHAELGRDEQFSPLYRLQCAYCFSRSTKKPSLMKDPSGYERWWIIRNSPGHFLGTRPNCDIWIFVNGGDWKCPATLPARTSVVILSVSVFMFCLTEIRFSWILYFRSPWKGIIKPYEKPSNKNWSSFLGKLNNHFLKVSTLIGVITFAFVFHH